MAQDDWFRRKTWSKDDQETFFKRWARSRSPFHKAQYLRIQAHVLSQVGDADLTAAALALLERHFAEFDDPYERMQAHDLAADCYERLNQLSNATHHFRQALKMRPLAPNMDCGTELSFAWFIVRHHLSDCYDEALDILERAHVAFPFQTFRVAAIRALIASSRRDHQSAARFAAEALEAASKTQSPFRYHRKLGLVGAEDSDIVRTMQELAAA